MQREEINRPRSTPVKYLAGLAVLMVLSAWLAWQATRNRLDEESTVIPTALGDHHLHPSGIDRLPVDLLGLPLAYERGKPLYPRSRSPRQLSASALHRVGSTDKGGYGIYEESINKKAPPGEKPHRLFLLVGWESEEPGKALVREVGERKYRGADPSM
jgi:hypothetical protein